MTSTPVTSHPVTDRVREALAVTLRGADELIPEADWVQKLARALTGPGAVEWAAGPPSGRPPDHTSRAPGPNQAAETKDAP